MPTSKGDKGVYVTLRLPEDFPKELAKPKILQEIILKVCLKDSFMVNGKMNEFVKLNETFWKNYQILMNKYGVEFDE